MDERQIDNLVTLIVDRIKGRLPMASESTALQRGPHGCVGCPTNATGGEFGCRGLSTMGATRLGTCSRQPERPAEIAPYIDHTLLKPEATKDEIVELCREAKEHGFASVCVNAAWVRLAAGLLRGSRVKVCVVVGFPLGAMSASAKAYEARDAVRQGAQEVDMVLNIGALKSKIYEDVLDDIAKVVQAASPAPVKVILETSKLSEHEKVIACSLSRIAGAAFVKTSTGFGGGGATVADVTLMKSIVGDELEVKASGGIRSSDDAMAMIAAGATRLGASASVAIVTGQKSLKKPGSY